MNEGSEEDVSVFRTNKKKRTKVFWFLLLILVSISVFLVTCLIVAGVVVGRCSGVISNISRGYPDNEEILQSMEEISASLVGVVNSSVVTIGHSVEHNPIKMLRISSSEGSAAPLVWVVCGVHAREWTSPLVCLQIIKNIRNSVETNSNFHPNTNTNKCE